VLKNFRSLLDVNTLKDLVQEGMEQASIDIQCARRYLLSNAALYGKLDVIEYFASLGVHGYVSRMLPLAALAGHIDVVRYLLDSDEDKENINTFAYAKEVFENAIKGGHLDMVQFLVEQGFDVKLYKNSLALAVENGSKKMIQYLLDQDADIHALCDAALQKAAQKGDLELVKLLVDRGANIYADNGKAAQLALKYNHPFVLNYLLHLDNSLSEKVS
jgi:hypothetical protein